MKSKQTAIKLTAIGLDLETAIQAIEIVCCEFCPIDGYFIKKLKKEYIDVLQKTYLEFSGNKNDAAYKKLAKNVDFFQSLYNEICERERTLSAVLALLERIDNNGIDDKTETLIKSILYENTK